MKLTIANFLGCARADLDLDGIALVCARNHAGKTSIARACAAVFGGVPVPFDELRASHAGMLIRSGAGAATIDLTTSTGTASVRYPAAKVHTTGAPVSASPFALGRKALDRLEPAERARALLDLLKAAPTAEDLATAGREIGLTDAQIAALQQRVADTDWDGALDEIRKKGQRLKGQWQQVTGEHYGPAKAGAWLPPQWASDLEGASEESLQALLTQAREWHEAAVSQSAVGEAERERLAGLAAQVPALEAKVEAGRARVAQLAEVGTARKRELDGLPRPLGEEVRHVCPHCQGQVVIRGGSLAIPSPVSPEENASRATTIRLAEQALAAVGTEHQTARGELAAAEGALQAAKSAARQAETMGRASADAPADVERAREGVALAEGRLKAFQAHREASRLAVGITTNAKIQDLLAPDGLRQKKLGAAIAGFNGVLASRCASARWPTVEIDPDLLVTVGGRAIVVASESEKWMARAVLQVAIAGIDGSAVLVLDGADVLDKAGRNGLIRLLATAGRPAVVCMTMDELGRVPSMRGRGTAYWIEDGVAQRVADEVP